MELEHEAKHVASRGHTLVSLGLMPVLMGLGHLLPVVGAIQAATGSYQFPKTLLTMIGTAATLVDSYDTYKDIASHDKPSKWAWKAWICSLWAIVLMTTMFNGLDTAISMYRFSFIGLCWGTPCVPLFSLSHGFHFYKPKTVFREAKSLVVAVCMGYITADTTQQHMCHPKNATCAETTLRARSLCLVILYQFLRETACDVRDLEEDSKDEMNTLPVRLGKFNCLFVMAVIGMALDALLVKGVVFTSHGLRFHAFAVLGSVLRVVVLMLAYVKILQYPRTCTVAWGAMSLLGLLPVLWAQAALKVKV